jgi:hypothetical protein
MSELSDATAALVQLTTMYAETRDNIVDLMTAPADGGPNADGFYDVPLPDGSGTIRIPSFRKIMRLATTPSLVLLNGAGPFTLTAEQAGSRISIANGAATSSIIVNVPPVDGLVWFLRQRGAAPLLIRRSDGTAPLNTANHNGTGGVSSGVAVSIEGGVLYLDGNTAVVS